MPTLPSKKARMPVHGVLLLDKPAGCSSNDALIKTKRLFNAQKAGHTGTLDPFATGLLPLCFGEATKFTQGLLDADKVYETVVHLGITTTTGDTEGDIVATHEVNTTPAQIASILTQFRGEIEQIPPMYSALKHNGKALYEYARAGMTLERNARRITIHALDFLQYEAPYLTLRVSCSKGTYIRTLGQDIGHALGCGAHLHMLRRTQVGEFKLDDAVTIDELMQLAEPERMQALTPIDTLLLSLPVIMLSDALATRFLHGQRLSLHKENIPIPAEGRVRVYEAPHARLLGTACIIEEGVLVPERLISTIMTPL